MANPQQPGAYIDLKEVDFAFRDGYLKTGAVGTGGAAQGVSTVPVTGFTGIIPSGVRVKFGAQATVYTVASTVETSGNTTSLVISPPLSDAVAAAAAVVAGPRYLNITVGEGNLTASEKVNREYKKDRGKLDQVRNGDEEPVDVTFSFAWIYLGAGTDDDYPTPPEFLKQEGPAAGYTTTGAPCEPFAIDIVILNHPDNCGGVTDPNEEIVFPQFRYESLDYDAKAGTVSATGKCNVTKIAHTRRAAA